MPQSQRVPHKLLIDNIDSIKQKTPTKAILAQARNRTGGSTMATLNFSTKPLALIVPWRHVVTKCYDLYFESCDHIGV